MPPETFLMTGACTPFRLADSCSVSDGPHTAYPDERRYMVADARVRDGSASVRVAVWRCRSCKKLLVGVGSSDHALMSPFGTGVHIQDFTWLEEEPPDVE